MANKESTKAGGAFLKVDPTKAQGTGDIAEFMVENYGTTSCSGNMTLSEGAIGSIEVAIPEDATWKKASG